MENLLSDLYTILYEVENYIAKPVYKFLPEEDFKKIDTVEESQLVYWSEIIQRFHICSATSLLRIKKWFDAMQSAFEVENYYGFCASLRGLLEACSDSFYTIGRVILPITDNFQNIKKAISGEAQKIILAEDLETQLIHYTHGRKLSKSDKQNFPSSHNAKQIREYLQSINSESLEDLYSELCQISHPSTMSFLPFMTELDNLGLTLHNEKIDSHLILNILKRHRETIYSTTSFALGPSLCGLKIINSFNLEFLESLKTDEKAFIYFEKNKLWQEIMQKIEV
jgi:hypothetical protein